MKAVVLKKLGNPSVLQVSNVPDPSPPSSNEVTVRIKVAGLNFAETLMRRGLYQWIPGKKKTGFVLGMEGAGVVEEIGPEVTEFSPGDRVIVGSNSGLYAQFVKVPKTQVYPAIESFSFEENAAFAVSFLTAHVGLEEMARVRKGETLLIHAAAGALGTAAVQLGRAFGLEIVGTASTSAKIQFLTNKMSIQAINYQKDDFKAFVNTWTKGTGVDVILESIGGKVFRDSLSCLAPMGRIIVVGLSSIQFSKFNPFSWWGAWRTLPRVNILKMLGLSQGIMAFHLGRLLSERYEQLVLAFEKLRKMVLEYDLRPIIDNIYPLEDATAAHRRLESRQSIGKVLLEIS
ncbi:MAG: NADPH:quinone oxidoreductase family protein [Candidatus Hodarchaeota archaeon]